MIRGCKNCASLPPFGQLPLLKELVVEDMDGVKVVGPELLGNGNAFPSLEILSFEWMSGWEVWSTINGDTGTSFPHLQKLYIKYCSKLVEASLGAIPSLGVLDICSCGVGVLRSVVHAASSITKLVIYDISGLTQLKGIVKYLGAVEKVNIKSCNAVRYLWESEAQACKTLVNLRKLKVYGCDNLVGLGEKEENNCESCLTSLRQVDISCCGRLERYSCPNDIEMLTITSCRSLTSVAFPRGGQRKLKSLWIWNCEKLLEEEEEELGGGGGGEKSRVLLNRSMSMLKSIYINNWSNLKSFPDLSCYVHLNQLTIRNCKNLESFPDEELPKLTSLKHIQVSDCQRMDDSFPRGNWPPKLTYLSIGRLKKPTSEWGQQNFPSSLLLLYLDGTPSSSEDVVSSSQLSHILPSSLKFLSISKFEKLESVSMGLQHLISLQQLHISHCPILRDLPEMLLPSLLELNINRCPKLKERCSSRRGSYRPHISHIPRINIR